MLSLKRGNLTARNSLWIRNKALLKRTTFYSCFGPSKRWNSSVKLDSTSPHRSKNHKDNLPAAWALWFSAAIGAGAVGFVAWRRSEPFRHTCHAVVRCSRVAREITVVYFVSSVTLLIKCLLSGAAVLGAVDYKISFAKSYESDEARFEAYSECHKRSAERLLKALLANGGAWHGGRVSHPLSIIIILCLGVFIKLGQHMASL